jgi:hypothetical protein
LPHAQEGAQRASAVPQRARPVHPRVTRLIAAGLIVAAGLAPLAAPPTPAAARDSTQRATRAIPVTRLLPERIRPGRIVVEDGIAVRAPKRGGFAFAIIEGADGRSRSLYLQTTGRGRVRSAGSHTTPTEVRRRLIQAETAAAGSTRPTIAAGTTAAADCRDRSRTLFPWRVRLLTWTLATRGAPSTLRDRNGGTKRLLEVMARAQHNVTWARNRCGRPDRVHSKGWFTNRTTRWANVSSGGGCTGGDGQSTISFGSLPYPSVAMTCVYGVRNGVASEADIRVNTNARWALGLGACSGSELLLESVMTHEFGHVYGLGHTHSSPWMTMAPLIRYCDAGPTTLGLGDLLGLEAKNP